MIIFDWDGTLADSISSIAESIIAACEKAGFDPPPFEKARYIVGLGIKESFEYLCPGILMKDFQKAALKYRDEFIEREKNINLFKGIKEGLVKLQETGVLLAVATGKSRAGLDRSIKHSGTGNFFHITRTADETQAKPDPLMLKEIINSLEVRKEECVMIGDTVFDLQMAQNAGIDSIAVTYGAHSKEKIKEENPLHTADSVDSLFDFIYSII